MKRIFAFAFSLLLGCCLLFSACGSPDPQTPSGPAPSGPQTPAETLPTSAEVVSAIRSTQEEAQQNYDFTLNIAGNVNVGAIQSPNANATYTCNYRYDKETGDLRFKRVTSGILLYDSTEYIYSQAGGSRITVKMNGKNEVKKTVVNYKDAELRLLNLPFEALLGSLTAEEIGSIAKSGNGYTASLKLSSDNAALSKICNAIGKMDSSINFKGTTFTNPVSGLGFEFTLSGGKLTGYTLKASISFPVKAASAQLDLTYTQRASSSSVDLPDVSGFITDGTEIGAAIGEIDAKLDDIGDDETYSLDFEAVNEMDPGVTTLATKDSLESRMYKNGTAFNDTYKYHTHHVDQGKENYSFTVGNIQDGTVHILSRKGKNTVTPVENVTAQTRFDEITELFRYTATDVDCLKKVTEGDTETYTLYLSDESIAALPQGVCDLLNKNTADGIVPVENYFNNEDYTIKDATFTVVIKAGKLASMTLETEIKYNPTAGDYTENNVTLNNELTLKVDEKLAKAQSYEAPKKAESLDNLLGLFA